MFGIMMAIAELFDTDLIDTTELEEKLNGEEE